MFTGDLLPSNRAAGSLDPFALQAAFPPSMVGRDSDDYYESYAPTRRPQLTLRLASRLKEARRHRAGSHVHCRSLGGVGAQLFPCGPGVAITRTLATRPDDKLPSWAGLLANRGFRAPLARPVSIGFEPGVFA